MLLFAVRNDIMEIVQSKRIAFDIKRKVHAIFVVNVHFASFDKSFVGILCVLFNIICMLFFFRAQNCICQNNEGLTLTLVDIFIFLVRPQ